MTPSSRSSARQPPDSSGFARRCYPTSLLTFFSGVLATCITLILLEWEPTDRSNIGQVKSSEFLSYGPMDVVYTWVNGTDPRWKKDKEFWHKHWIASLTGQPLPVWGEPDANDVKGKDDSNAENRFRDNEELRYSLRALEKYAPWVRHIYVVTDGQIPSWLDMETSKLTIVKHDTIFTNKSHLPVFSSPAIEWNLDNIPGLSEMFLYFNDDVFLGAPVRPEDFVSQAGVQKAYFAWEIPLCSSRCWESSLADGVCDKECNVTACDFDMGDCGCDVNPLDETVTCDAEKIATILDQSPKISKIDNNVCHGTCYYYWLGNGYCDTACNVSSCAFDGGDCKAMDVDADDGEEQQEEKAGSLSSLVRELWSADVAANHTLVQVPLDVNATYLNLTDVFGVNGSIWTAAHDNEHLVRFASVYETEMALLLVFGRDRDASPMTASAQISVDGEDAEGNPIHLELSIVRGNDQIEASFGPAQEGYATEISGGVFTFQNTSISPHLIRLPFDFWQATFRLFNLSNNEYLNHTATPEDNEDVFLDLSIEDEHADRSSRQVSLIEVFLPFNVTGKQLGDGDLLNLGWHLDMRLHNDENDIDWSDHDVCQLQVPKEKPLVPPTASTVVVDDETRKSTAVADSRHVSSEGETQTEDDGVPVIGVPIAETDDEETLVNRNVDKDSEHTDDKREEDTAAEVFESDSGTAKCRLNEENDGIYVTVRVLPNHVHNAFSAQTGRGLGGDIVETDTPQTAEKSSTSASNDAAASINSNVDMLTKEWETSPQVTDGQICFYDTSRVDSSRNRYCFALAMGHYHSEEVELVHKPTLWALQHPPKPKVIYTPYMGDNPALIELSDKCIDTTRRLIGIRSRVCYPNEVPAPRPPVKDEARADLQRQQEEDLVAARNRLHLHEGRQLACEAQKRRFAQHKEHEQEEDEAQASGDIFGRLNHAIRYMKLLLNLGDVVPTNDSLDHTEYEDVCEHLPVTADKEKPEVTLANAQAHLSKDTFGDSLRYVNKLYNRVFGKPTTSDRRRVPSHMPFLLQKSIIREIKDYWTTEVQDTSAHRFRHPQDMQFSFSYFHYLVNRAKIHPHTLEEIWREYLDANRNGILDENEVLTAASLAYGDAPTEDFVTEVRECMQSEKRVKAREVPTAEGTLRLTETLTPHITLENLERCPKIRDALIKNVRYEAEVELMSEKEVTFHMLSDNYDFAWKQMMGTRARRTKFVCINDDMKYPSTAVSKILHELFLSIWPKRSQFELPYHLKNRYAHIDEYNAAQERRQIVVWMALMISLLVAFVFRAELRTMLAFQDIARARAESASQLAQDFQQAQEKDKSLSKTSPMVKKTSTRPI